MINIIKHNRVNKKLKLCRFYSASSEPKPNPNQNPNHPADRNLRINEVGVQMINEHLRSHLFDKLQPRSPELIDKSKQHLNKFKLNNKELHPMADVNEFELPKLNGKNIEEHFANIGHDQIEPYTKLVSLFASNGIPKLPAEFRFTPGWTKYDPITHETSQVEYPSDEALVFDVESLVLCQNCPVMCVAVSSSAWYSWCNERLIQNDFMYLNSLQFSDLIPLESKDAGERLGKKRVVIGHNVGFDRSFVREQYFLKVTLELFFAV